MKKNRPPQLARKFFEWYCAHANVADLLGDLDELYYYDLSTKSRFRASLQYWVNVFSLITSYAIRKRKRQASVGHFATSTISMGMVHSYLKVAVRNLYQHKYFSLLNAFGLALGMSISLLLISMYSYIRTYDNFHENEDNIYSIITTRTDGMEKINFDSAPAVVGEKIKEEFPGVREVVRIYSSFAGEVIQEKENIPVRGYYTDANFLSVFTFPLLTGNPYTALSQPHSIVLTETTALKIFATLDVIGKVVAFNDSRNYVVTGVLKNIPKNTHFKFEALVSYSSLPFSTSSTEDQWSNYRNQYVYMLFPESGGPDQLQHYLEQTAKSIYAPLKTKVDFGLQSLYESTISEHYNGIGVKWELSGFIVFGIIAVLILLPACFNYTNISIARSLKRYKEIGLRKTMGGVSNHIFFQFITETVVITLISLIGAIGIFMLIRSEFQSMLVAASSLDLSLTWTMVALFILFALMVGFVAGAFPALYFAGLNPIEALKSKPSNKALSSLRLRKGLIIFQFALSFCFIVSLLTFGRQYRTLLNFDFGFQKENIVDVDLQGVSPALFKTEFSKLSSVQAVSLSSGALGLSHSTVTVHTPEHDSLEASQLFIDADFIPNFKLELISGKNFPANLEEEEKYLIVNEEFLARHKLDLAEATGKTFFVDGKELAILGVVKNFNYAPPQVPVGNFIFRMNPQKFNYANLRVDVGNVYTVFSDMENVWKTVDNKNPFNARFFEDELNESYSSYRILLKIAGFLGLLAITVSLLGLLGMVVYTSESRVKEVSIRKVLGATAFGITLLLSKDYFKLILWAFLLAVPLVIFIFHEVFSRIPDYYIHLTVGDVVLGFLVLLGLGFITISTQTYKTALANPAETLKAE
jgi:putative ABC transport system permease protein